MKHTIYKPTFERNDERGLFQEILNQGNWRCIIQGDMKKDSEIGNHYHKKTEIFFFLISGKAHVVTLNVINGETDDFELLDNTGIILKCFETHKIKFLLPSQFIMLKSEIYNPEKPDTYEYPL